MPERPSRANRVDNVNKTLTERKRNKLRNEIFDPEFHYAELPKTISWFKDYQTKRAYDASEHMPLEEVAPREAGSQGETERKPQKEGEMLLRAYLEAAKRLPPKDNDRRHPVIARYYYPIKRIEKTDHRESFNVEFKEEPGFYTVAVKHPNKTVFAVVSTHPDQDARVEQLGGIYRTALRGTPHEVITLTAREHIQGLRGKGRLPKQYTHRQLLDLGRQHPELARQLEATRAEVERVKEEAATDKTSTLERQKQALLERAARQLATEREEHQTTKNRVTDLREDLVAARQERDTHRDRATTLEAELANLKSLATGARFGSRKKALRRIAGR